MTYFGKLPIPTAAQRREGDALSPFSVDEFGNGQRMILLPRSDGEAPFWAKVIDVLNAYKKNPSAELYFIPRIMSGPENVNGRIKVSSSYGVKQEDVVEVVEKFPIPAKDSVVRLTSTPVAPAFSPDRPSTSNLPLVLGVAGVALVAVLLLRR